MLVFDQVQRRPAELVGTQVGGDLEQVGAMIIDCREIRMLQQAKKCILHQIFRGFVIAFSFREGQQFFTVSAK